MHKQNVTCFACWEFIELVTALHRPKKRANTYKYITLYVFAALNQSIASLVPIKSYASAVPHDNVRILRWMRLQALPDDTRIENR